MSPLLYLTLCSIRNRMRVRLKRLKEPRYFIGLLAGLAYFYIFLRPRAGSKALAELFGTSNVLFAIELAGAAFLFLLFASACLPSGRGPALNFTPADIQFLFPAPLRRKDVLQYKVIRSLVPILISSAIMTIFFRRGNLADSWMFFAGMSLIFMAINLYTMGVSLSRGSRSALRWLLPILAAGATIVLAATVMLDWGTLTSLSSPTAILAEVVRMATTGPAGIVLWPFRALARLPLTRTPLDFLRALPGPAVILVLSYYWVIQSKTSFEEASAELAEKIARFLKDGKLWRPKPGAGRQTSNTQGQRSTPQSAKLTPFRLSLEGRPETAILWKNLISVGRNLFSFQTFIFLGAFTGVGMGFIIATFFSGRDGQAGRGSILAGVLCGMIYFVTVMLGPQIARNDLRRDLANLDVLKTWPISGSALVRGEVLAPAVLLTGIAWLCAFGGLVFGISLKLPPSWIVAAVLLTPGVILLQLLAQNAIAVVWPSWAMIGPGRARGIDVMGQRLLMMAGLVLVLAAALLPAAIAGGVAGLGIHLLTGGIPIVVPALVAAAMLLCEAFVVSGAVGRLLDRTDISAIDAQE